MFKLLRWRNTYANVGVTVALVFAMTGFAVAATSSTGAIHGCYKTAAGTLRVLTGSKHCSKRETPISWNEQGPSGSAGVPGKDGANGAAGTTGAAGALATNGATGTTGAAGATHVTVVKGNVAITGGAGNVAAGIACPVGQVATGGGFNSGDLSAVVTLSQPSADGGTNPAATGTTPNGWVIDVHSAATTTGNIVVICASP